MPTTVCALRLTSQIARNTLPSAGKTCIRTFSRSAPPYMPLNLIRAVRSPAAYCDAARALQALAASTSYIEVAAVADAAPAASAAATATVQMVFMAFLLLCSSTATSCAWRRRDQVGNWTTIAPPLPDGGVRFS